MRIVQVSDLREGQVLARAVFNERGACLLNAKVILTPRYIGFLRERGFAFVYVEDAETEDVEVGGVVEGRVRRLVTDSLYRVYHALERATEEVRHESTEPTRRAAARPEPRREPRAGEGHDALVAEVAAIVEEVVGESRDQLVSMRSHDNYTFFHAIDTAVAAVMLGKRLYFDRERLTQLARGGLLHDIGMIFVDPKILNNKEPLGVADWDRIRQHPTLGYDLLRRLPNADPITSHVAYQHHERQDGSGYPRGIHGTNRIARGASQRTDPGKIIFFAEIVAIASVYDALCAERPYRPAMAPESVVTTLREMAGRALNRELVEQFLAILPVYPVGSEVIVQSGQHALYRGVVARSNRQEPDRPVIRLLYDQRRQRIKPIDLDLAISDAVVVAVARAADDPRT